jgi:hypothetical protein
VQYLTARLDDKSRPLAQCLADYGASVQESVSEAAFLAFVFPARTVGWARPWFNPLELAIQRNQRL